jgi:hypothetical protein
VGECVIIPIRNDKGEYPATAIADAQRDVDAALALTGKMAKCAVWPHIAAFVL